MRALTNLSVRVPPKPPRKSNVRTRRDSYDATQREDMIVGQRVRLRRTELGMSQSKLAEGLGLSFQQVQKYEKGFNRIPAGRLRLIADLLEVPVMFLYGQSAGSNEVDSLLMIDPSSTLRLLRAYGAIKDIEVARKMVEVMERIATAY